MTTKIAARTLAAVRAPLQLDRLSALRVAVRRAEALGGAPRSHQLAFDFDAPPVSVAIPAAPIASAGLERAPSSVVAPASAPASIADVAPAQYPAAEAAPPSAADGADAAYLAARLAVIQHTIAAATKVPVHIVLTENRRTMISTQRRDGALVVRLHRMFLRAGPTIVTALGRYLSRSDARASRLVSEFIESQRAHVRPPRPHTLRHAGHHHDLRALFDEVNATEFGGAIEGVGITWGRHGGRARRRRSIRLGTYTRQELLVRIHPALDAAWVPRFFVRYIVFHELLHHVEPEIEHEGRTEFHTPRFRARERAYGDYTRALAWERENLGRLLRPSAS